MTIGDKLFVADKPTLDSVKALIGASNPASGDLTTLFNGLKLINTLIGATGDGAGVVSVFGKLAAILADTALIKGYTDRVEDYTDTVETLIGAASPASGDLTTVFRGLKLIADYVDTLETKVGLNNDAAGTTTLFARLAQIAGYVDQVEGYTDTVESSLATVQTDLATIKGYTDTLETKLGLNTDAAGTTTTFARLAQVAGYVDTLETLVGTADPATGDLTTLFKGLKLLADRTGINGSAADPTGAINAKLAAVLQRVGGGTPNFFYASVDLAAGTVTLCNISGSGVFLGMSSMVGYQSNCIITIDGAQRYSGPFSWGGSSSTTGGSILHGPMRFSSSLVITLSSDSGYMNYVNATVLTGVA